MHKTLLRFAALFCTVAVLASVGGAWATWKYASLPPQNASADIPLEINEFDYTPELPVGEVSFLKRINDVLNNDYSNDTIEEGSSMQYLLSTLDKNWDAEHNPALGSFVGSMDPTAESQARINALFGDIIDLNHVSFILKSEDLVGGVDNEIALYTTSDPLTWSPNNYINSVVGVYLSVFVPILDDQGNVVGYEQLCDSIHGYCLEVQYMEGVNVPSFSTDHWRDELYYWHEKYADPQPIIGEDRYNYDCYHPADGNYAYPDRTLSWLGWINVQTDQWAIGDFMGKKAWQCLQEILDAQS